MPKNIVPPAVQKLSLPEFPLTEYTLGGTAKVIEEILKELGKDIRLARDGTNKWEVKEGSAKIRITYNTDTFFISGDAYLCQLPEDSQKIKIVI